MQRYLKSAFFFNITYTNCICPAWLKQLAWLCKLHLNPFWSPLVQAKIWKLELFHHGLLPSTPPNNVKSIKILSQFFCLRYWLSTFQHWSLNLIFFSCFPKNIWTMALLLIINLRKMVSLSTYFWRTFFTDFTGTAALWFTHSMFPKPSEPEISFKWKPIFLKTSTLLVKRFACPSSFHY